MHSSHTGWSSPTGCHSVTWRRAQRSAGGKLLHTTQSSSGIGMAAACSPKVANRCRKEGLSVKGVWSIFDCGPTYAPHLASLATTARAPPSASQLNRTMTT